MGHGHNNPRKAGREALRDWTEERGRAAKRAGKPQDANPYNKEKAPTDHHLWDRGWFQEPAPTLEAPKITISISIAGQRFSIRPDSAMFLARCISDGMGGATDDQHDDAVPVIEALEGAYRAAKGIK